MRLIAEAGKYADRLSINIEVPGGRPASPNSRRKKTCVRSVAPWAGCGSSSMRRDGGWQGARPKGHSAPRFAPAGQSTQMIVGADAANDKTILATSANLYGSYQAQAGLLLRVQPNSGCQPRVAAAGAAFGPRTPALPGRLADAILRFRRRRDTSRIAGGMLPLDIDPKLAWALAAPRPLPARYRQSRQPRRIAAGARLRRQGGRPYHRHPPRDFDSRPRIWPGCTSSGNKALPFIVLSDHRPPPHLLDAAKRSRSVSSQRRCNWDLGFSRANCTSAVWSSDHRNDRGAITFATSLRSAWPQRTDSQPFLATKGVCDCCGCARHDGRRM